MQDEISLAPIHSTPGYYPRCQAPWQTIMITASGHVFPCAYRNSYENHSELSHCGNINENTLEEIWNGEEFQRLRENMGKGDLKKAGCSNCLALKQNLPLSLDYNPDVYKETPLKTAYAKNLSIKQQEILNKTTILKSSPTVIYYTPSHHCNLRCLHCYQNPDRKLSIKRKDVNDEILALMPTATKIVAGGGEPLILPLWRKMLASYKQEINPYLKFATATNATIVPDKILNHLKKFPSLELVVSIDATEKYLFEKIRLKATYEVVVENLLKLKELIKSKPHSNIVINFSAMKDNILSLPSLIKFCVQHEIGYNIQPVVDYPVTQSLRAFFDVKNEMKAWKEALQQSHELLDQQFKQLNFVDEQTLQLYHNHLYALDSLIPYELLSQHYYFLTVAINARLKMILRRRNLMSHDISNFQKCYFVSFFKINEGHKLHHESQFYGKIENGMITANLPKGRYIMGFFKKDEAMFSPQPLNLNHKLLTPIRLLTHYFPSINNIINILLFRIGGFYVKVS